MEKMLKDTCDDLGENELFAVYTIQNLFTSVWYFNKTVTFKLVTTKVTENAQQLL